MPTASWCVTLTPNPCPPTTVARPHRRYYSISDWAPREMCLPPRDPFSPPVSPTRIAGQAGARGRVQAQRADVRHRRNRARRAMGRLPVAEQRGGRRRIDLGRCQHKRKRGGLLDAGDAFGRRTLDAVVRVLEARAVRGAEGCRVAGAETSRTIPDEERELNALVAVSLFLSSYVQLV